MYHAYGDGIKAVAQLELRHLAARLSGEVCGNQVLAPGPGHSSKDRSLAVKLDANAPGGILVHSFADDDFRSSRDHVFDRLGLPQQRSYRQLPPRLQQTAIGVRTEKQTHPDRASQVRAIWEATQPISGTPAETYLRIGRGISCALPPSLRFLPPEPRIRMLGPWPMLVAGFAAAGGSATPIALHIIRLAADGRGKAPVPGNEVKRSLGSPCGRPIHLAAMETAAALVIAEGIEDALSVHEGTGTGAWASGGAPFLPHLGPAVLRAGAESVTIAVDVNPAGLGSASKLGRYLSAHGIEVRFMRPERWRGAR